MKKILSFFALLLFASTLMAQTTTLTFTGRDANNHFIPLNRVVITNLTKGWQETIYWPDTALVMQVGTGIEDYAEENTFKLLQNNPNPFNGTTEANLTVVEPGDVSMEISDVNGRIVETQNFASLQTGNYRFRIQVSAAGIYFLTARQRGKSSTIKMVNNGSGSENSMEFVGLENQSQALPQTKSSIKGSTNNPFSFGDNMEYVGYAIINGQECESQRISQQQGSSQSFILQFSAIQALPPTVTTTAVSNITQTSASTGGNVTSDGGANVIVRGVCWGTNQNPTTADSHTTDGSGIGSFTSSLIGLTMGITYYVRAYATNSVGTAYGEQQSFTTTEHLLPTVVTSAVTDITQTTATCGGNVTSDGGTTVTARGVCWGTNSNPTVNDNHTSDGSGTGSFSSNITGLSVGTTYYVRAYAVSSVGTAYGNEVSFTTTAYYLPTVTTSAVTNVGPTTATCGGNVTDNDDGNAMVTARGVCWSTSQNPTISDSHTTDGTGAGSFSSNLTGLTASTTYYVRAYAINSVGVAYGNVETFTTSAAFICGMSTLTDVDSNVYNTVQIGNQCWMRENLRTTKYADGTNISLGSSTSTTTAYRYYPNNTSSNVSTYGYLYNWKAVMHNSSSSSTNPSGVQGICPNGWHVPSNAEWTQLTNYVSSQSEYVCGSDSTYIAKSLASTTEWRSCEPSCTVGNNPNGNDATGFSAVSAGNYYSNYGAFGNDAYMWSSTMYDNNYAYYFGLHSCNAEVSLNSLFTNMGFSVRCIRD